MRQIDGLVTKDEIYRLISGFRTRFKISEEAAHEMAKRVAEMPTVEAEPVKHGRWIIDYAEGSKIYHAHCSECNKEPDRNIGGDYYIDKLSDFCPNCGARMDGDNE